MKHAVMRKVWGSAVSVILAGALLTGCGSSASGTETGASDSSATTTTEVVAETEAVTEAETEAETDAEAEVGTQTGLEPILWTEADFEINNSIPNDNGVQMLYQGYYEQEITVGETTRSAKVYIPEGSDQGSYFVILTVPDEMNTEEFLLTNGWMEEAEENDFCLFVMESEAGNGQWGSVEDEAAYVEAAYAAVVAGSYYLPFPTFYIVGYGTGGTALHKYIMTNAITVAGAVFVDASDIAPEYLEEMSSAKYKNSDISYSEVPAPVWLVSTGSEGTSLNVVDYWMSANECEADGEDFSLGSTIYRQMQDTDNAFTTRGNVSAVAVLDGAENVMDPTFADAVYTDFLSQYTRYGGNAGGNTLASRPDYEELGVEFKEMEVDGYRREYMVYVPEEYKDSESALPVVYALHGSNQTHKMMFDISRWFEVAQQEGFIVVMPVSTLNPVDPFGAQKVATPMWNSSGSSERADDILFLGALIEQVDTDYNVDTNRRYISGQSNGSMMAFYAGMEIPEYFAAIGATSGPIMGAERIPEDAATSVLPIYLLMGEYDLWDWNPVEGIVNVTLDYWINRNHAGSLEEPSIVKFDGRYTNFVWENEEEIPLIRYTQTAGRGHSFLPEELEMIWEWMETYSRDEGQGILYNGTKVSAD